VDKIKQHFEAEARDFDRIILTLIPDYPGMVKALVEALPFERALSIKVIDLGCGTGTVAQGVLDAFPNAQVTCLDLAENMIAMAQSKLARYSGVRFVVGDFTTFDGEYDVVIFSLALHHLATDQDKQNFYRVIFGKLSAGGAFYNGDVVLASGNVLQAKYMEQWRGFMRHNISEQEIEDTWIAKYQAEDHPARLADQLAWLTEIGFADVDVVWKHCNFAVYGGVKP
jgi:tRNA (cmo5U34)-methyltransferase